MGKDLRLKKTKVLGRKIPVDFGAYLADTLYMSIRRKFPWSVEIIPGGVLFTRASFFSGLTHSVIFNDLTLDDFIARFNRWEAGTLIQEAFAEFSTDLREFIVTGMTPKEWNDSFGEEE